MISPMHLHAIAEGSAAGILTCLAEGAVIVLFAWILLRVFGPQNSGTRFAVWFSALLAIAFLPLVERSQSGAANSASPGTGHSLITISGSWALVIFGCWGLLTAVGLMRVAIGFIKLRRLRQSCKAIDPDSVDSVLNDAVRESGHSRKVRICTSDELRVPTAIGFLQPVVILPTWAVKELSTSELKAVLLHELAHLRRWDDWTNLVQKILHAALFFHPAVWWIEGRLSLEREMACDDIVLAHTENPQDYAQCLLAVAEKSFERRGLSLAQAAVNRMRQTSLRVSQILDANRPGRSRSWRPFSALLGTFALLSFIVAPRFPQLVSFRDKTPTFEIATAKSDLQPRAEARFVHLAAFHPPESTARPTALRPSGDEMARPSPLNSQSMRTVTRVPREAESIRASMNSENMDVEKTAEPTIIGARLPSGERTGSAFNATKTGGIGQVHVSQTLFVIMQMQQGNYIHREVWTVRVWQVTFFQPHNAIGNSIPAKKA